MKCLDIERFLDAYLDHEFDARERLEFELHIDACEDCRLQVQHQHQLRKDIREALHSPAPDTLHTRIDTLLDDAPPSPRSASWTRWGGWRYLSMAAAAAALLGLTFAGISTEPTNLASSITAALGTASLANAHSDADEDVLVRESIDWHRRKLPLEVTGPRSESVRTWFRDKVDFPVRLPRFRAPDVALLGGRLAHVHDRKAALVTLEVKQRKLSMMVFPSPQHRLASPALRAKQPRVTMRTARGYNIAIVRDGDITYSLTSDLPQRELSNIIITSF